MITHAEYMANSAKLHNAYYGEIADEARVDVRAAIMARCLKAEQNGDEHYNRAVPLGEWDGMAQHYRAAMGTAFKARGDFWSLSGAVCVMKAFVRNALAKARGDE